MEYLSEANYEGIGFGLGLALVPDFRVTCPEARFSSNFTRLGFHPGFGLTHTLPALIGQQQAHLMFYTGRRLGGEEAVKMVVIDPENVVRFIKRRLGYTPSFGRIYKGRSS